MFFDAILDAIIDCLRLLPFLFLTYLAMEILEKREGASLTRAIRKAGKLGPLWGSLLGVVPQCGFSAAASSLFAGRVITVGTLCAVFLSTSDEMLPVFISQSVPVSSIMQILAMKVVIAIITGFVIDFTLGRVLKSDEKDIDIHKVCEHEHCDCHDGVLKSSLIHTVKIAFYILVLSSILNILIETLGENTIAGFLGGNPVASIFVAAIVGLIPNCASSVIIAELYIEGMIGTGAMMSGLLVGAGVGVMILLRLNEDKKENAAIVATIYLAGVLWGLLINAIF